MFLPCGNDEVVSMLRVCQVGVGVYKRDENYVIPRCGSNPFEKQSATEEYQ